MRSEVYITIRNFLVSFYYVHLRGLFWQLQKMKDFDNELATRKNPN